MPVLFLAGETLAPNAPRQKSISSSGGGEVFVTTETATRLPNDRHLTFEVTHHGAWHEVTLVLDTRETLHALRLDPCAGAGSVGLKGATLRDANGNVLRSWPDAGR